MFFLHFVCEEPSASAKRRFSSGRESLAPEIPASMYSSVICQPPLAVFPQLAQLHFRVLTVCGADACVDGRFHVFLSVLPKTGFWAAKTASQTDWKRPMRGNMGLFGVK